MTQIEGGTVVPKTYPHIKVRTTVHSLFFFVAESMDCYVARETDDSHG